MRYLILIVASIMLSACADRITAPIRPKALNAPNTRQIFVVTNRERNAAGYLATSRDDELTFLDTTVSIPPSHTSGEAPTFKANPDPEKHFVIAKEAPIASLPDLARKVSASLAGNPRRNREVTVFVHGFYNTYQDSLFRIAQLQNDFDLPGTVVNFAWASAGSPLGYAHDRESALYSRDDLERTLRELAKSRSDRLLLVGHSLGTYLITETLRQIEHKEPGWTARNIDALALISPDMPVDLFLRNLEPFDALPDSTVILTSTEDNALRLSSRINRSSQRLGQLSNPDVLADLPVIVFDVSSFADGSSNHMTFAESPALIALLRDARSFDELLAPDDPNFLLRQAERVRVSNEAIAIQVAGPGGST
ncbi:alpha/beta hydrolase [Shimia sp. MIT910701]|uniref:alpha/beta hydrolase n=1 Tax=Shimia sp. MIT910701 TaxID=3096987 RepID=UPI00399B18AC